MENSCTTNLRPSMELQFQHVSSLYLLEHLRCMSKHDSLDSVSPLYLSVPSHVTANLIVLISKPKLLEIPIENRGFLQ